MQVVQGLSGRSGSGTARSCHICAGEHLPQERLTEVRKKGVSKGLDTRGCRPTPDGDGARTTALGLPEVARKDATGSRKCGNLHNRRHILREMNRTENDAGLARVAELRFDEESSSESKGSL